MSLAEKGGGGGYGRGQKSRMIQIWSAATVSYCQCMIKQWRWSDLPHCWNGMIGTKYLLADCHSEWKDVFGRLYTVFVTKQSCATSFRINADKQCVMNDYKECFDGVHTTERKGQDKRNAFFSLWQWQVHSLQSTVAVSVSRGEGWGRRGGIFKWPALFGRPSPQGNYCGEPFSHLSLRASAVLSKIRLQNQSHTLAWGS